MSKFSFGFLDGSLRAGSLRQWAYRAQNARSADLKTLREQRGSAHAFKTQIERFLQIADERLAQSNNGVPAPHNADWSWRPAPWRGPLPLRGMSSVATNSTLGDEVTLFHDCTLSELTLSQRRNLREGDGAPYGLQLDVFDFDGSFLSLVVDLPDAAITGLRRTHVLRMETIVHMEKPLEIFARLNIRHGPNTEQMVSELALDRQNIRVEFDLAYANLNEKRVDRAWIDLIFEGPRMNQVTLRDLTFSRRPRAQI